MPFGLISYGVSDAWDTAFMKGSQAPLQRLTKPCLSLGREENMHLKHIPVF